MNINDSIVPPAQLENQLISSNCIIGSGTFGCQPLYCPPQPVHWPTEMQTVRIEKVGNGYIITGHHKGGSYKRVALDLAGLSAVLGEWCTGQSA